ncbi:hypothetical protein ABIA39_006443 [Nocardia sp. GAS34]
MVSDRPIGQRVEIGLTDPSRREIGHAVQKVWGSRDVLPISSVGIDIVASPLAMTHNTIERIVTALDAVRA